MFVLYGDKRLFCLAYGHNFVCRCGCSQGQLFRLQISINTGGLRNMGERTLISLWAVLEESIYTSVDT